ncbi:MAG: ImmA/IrrE family metallo-endopeptidase [Gammaproteobacteria bacterium]|nr:ImmA/IrrE family metallo-endopeptidase [Gammaproteobacteria bacterium]
MIRAPVNPVLLSWARERAGRAPEDLAGRFPKLGEWEAGTRQPTLRQVDAFASSVSVPVGYLFLSEPPAEPMPIPDFRTAAGTPDAKPSPDLLDVIHACQARQAWYRSFARMEGRQPLSFVASASRSESPQRVAAQMRETLGFDVADRRTRPTWTESLRRLIAAADAAGVLVMVSGIVASNTHRPLDPKEFRGFALSDPLAPLVFVNGAAAKAAQMFTLAHKLAHLWLGTSALCDCTASPSPSLGDHEVWCNAVAEQFLAPLATLREETDWLKPLKQRHGEGSSFHHTTLSRVGRRFAEALIVSTLEGQTLYRDAYCLLGVRRGSTFEELARRVAVGP